MNRKILFAPLALASAFSAAVTRKQSDFRQEYVPDWPTRSPQEVADIEANIAAADIAMFTDYYSFVGLDERGWIGFAIDNNRQRAGSEYEADHATFLYDGETGFVDIAGYGTYETSDEALLHVPDSQYFTFDRSDTETVLQSAQHDLVLRFGDTNPYFHDSRPEASVIMGIAPATLSWNGREITGDIVTERLGFKDFDRRKMGSVIAKQTLSNRGFHGLYLMTEYGEVIYLRAANMTLGLMEGPSAFGFGDHADHSGLLQSVNITVDEWRTAPGLYRLPRSWSATWGQERTFSLSVTEADNKIYTNWGLGGFAMTWVEGTLTSGTGERSRIAGFAEVMLP